MVKPKSSPINWEWGRKHLKNKGFWNNVSKNFNTAQDHVREFVDYINWRYLSDNRRFPFDDEFLAEFENKINWPVFMRAHKISEKTYLKFKDHISVLEFLSHNCEDKMTMINKYFYDISKVKTQGWGGYIYSDRKQFWQDFNLKDKFIEEHAEDEDDWEWISQYQRLSEKFIKKHYNKLNIKALEQNYSLSKDIKENIKNGIYM